MISVDLVGGPRDGAAHAVPCTPEILTLTDVDRFGVAGPTDRYALDEVGADLHLRPRYVYLPPSGGFRGQCSCACEKPGCPNYGVDA